MSVLNSFDSCRAIASLSAPVYPRTWDVNVFTRLAFLAGGSPCPPSQGRLRVALSRVGRSATGAHAAYIPSSIVPNVLVDVIELVSSPSPHAFPDCGVVCPAVLSMAAGARAGCRTGNSSEERGPVIVDGSACKQGDNDTGAATLAVTSRGTVLRRRRGVGRVDAAPLGPEDLLSASSLVAAEAAAAGTYGDRQPSASVHWAGGARPAGINPLTWYGPTSSPELRRAQVAFGDALAAAVDAASRAARLSNCRS